MTHLHARWVLPVGAPPVPNGTVIVADGRITYVGARRPASVAGANVDLGDAILMPGLVNAHIHLDLGGLAGRIAPQPFFPWIRALMGVLGTTTPDALRQAARDAVADQLASGVTTMADTAPNRFGFDALREAGARGIAFREVFGPDPAQCDAALAELREAVDAMRADATDLVQVGVSPHAPYSVSDALYRAVAAYASAAHVPVAVHIAESVDETALVREATGAFATYLRDQRAIPVAPRATSPIALLEQTGVLATRPLCIHAVQVDEDDIARMVHARATVAHCPCSNTWFAHAHAPVAAYRRAGLAVGLGTDSIASNTQVRLAVEAQHIADAALTAADRIAMATHGGAQALGLDDRIGTLRVGMEADLAAFPIEDHAAADRDPEAYVVAAAWHRPARMVMVAGRELRGRGA